MTNNLNPKNDPEVAEMLKESPEDRLWDFLDECVPSETRDTVLVMMDAVKPEVKNEEGYVSIPGAPFCAILTDLVFSKPVEELKKSPTMNKYEKYFNLIKDCYIPYFTECYILEDCDSLTAGQKATLKQIGEDKIAIVSMTECENAVKVAITFAGCGRNIYKEAWLMTKKLSWTNICHLKMKILRPSDV